MSVREEFEAWCKRDCSPGAATSDWYYRIWQAAYAAGQESMRAKLDEQWNDGFDNGKVAGRRAGLEEALLLLAAADYSDPQKIITAIRALIDAPAPRS